jgi:hypothetical protein
MKRRTFLTIIAGALAWGAARKLPLPHAAAQTIDRADKWKRSTDPSLGVEWRYVAGRVVGDAEDFGFVVAVIDVRIESNYELLVERQDFGGDRTFVTKSYTGTLAYDSASATYTFRDDQNQLLTTWQWDEAAQVYRLSVTTPELQLQDMALRPQGTVIPEGGDGVIAISPIAGIQGVSDYYADWTAIEIGGATRGTARLDMQGIRLASGLARSAGESSPAATDFVDHHWFAIAGQSDGAPVWISAWRIEMQGGPLWDVTIARGSNTTTTWHVSSFTEESAAVAPLAIEILSWQPIPPIGSATEPGTSTGAAWRLTAGRSQPGDLIDLTVAVPPGQFVATARAYTLVGQATGEEAVGTAAAGTIEGSVLSDVSLVVAETTAEFYLLHLPLIRS